MQVAFTQEAGPVGRLLLYDAYRKHVQELALTGERGTVELNLAGLRPGLYYYIHWIGSRKGQTGTLVVQP